MLLHIHKIESPLLLFVVLVFLIGCTKFSEEIRDPDAGINGGFEVAKNGLPVNWLMYTPNTVPNAKFEIILDQEEFIEGKQSLKFMVEKCASSGGWHSPGFTKQFDVEPGNTYKLSFWIKNKGAEFQVSAGGVSPTSGEMKILLRSNQQIEKWKQFKYEVPVGEAFSQIRTEVNVLQPGVFWIDDIQFEIK